VVTQVGSQTFGIVVDGVFHTEEIVVKRCRRNCGHIDMFSGNTILGDGAVIMIIDPNGIAKALGAAGSAGHGIADENAAAHASSGEQLTSLLVFRAGTNQPKAVPLGPSPGWKRSQPTRSSSATAVTWCSTRAIDAAGADGRRQRPDARVPADPGVCR